MAPGSSPDRLLKVDVTFVDEPPADVVSAVKDAGGQKVKQLRRRGLAGIETVVVSTIVASGFATLVKQLVGRWRCGLVVDARGARILTKRDCDLPRATVMFIDATGAESRLVNPSQSEIQALVEGGARPRQ